MFCQQDLFVPFCDILVFCSYGNINFDPILLKSFTRSRHASHSAYHLIPNWPFNYVSQQGCFLFYILPFCSYGNINPFNFIEGFHKNPSGYTLNIPFDTQGDFLNYVKRVELLSQQVKYLILSVYIRHSFANCTGILRGGNRNILRHISFFNHIGVFL